VTEGACFLEGEYVGSLKFTPPGAPGSQPCILGWPGTVEVKSAQGDFNTAYLVSGATAIITFPGAVFSGTALRNQ
jgi:hypothetical protein